MRLLKTFLKTNDLLQSIFRYSGPGLTLVVSIDQQKHHVFVRQIMIVAL